MQAIYSGLAAVGFLLGGCLAAEPRIPPAESEVAAQASGPRLSAAGAPAPSVTLPTLPSTVGPACRSDDDCRLVPDYCAECACVSLSAQQKMPECLGEEVKCVRSPCADHTALCIDGRCAAESGAFR